MNSHTDKELLILISKDNSKAFEEIYRRYWESLLDSSYKRIKDIDNSKDIVQNIFIDLWNRRAKVEIDNLAAYLNTAVRFQIFKLSAKKKSNPIFVELFDIIIATQCNIESSIQDKELKALFEAWLKCLPEKRKQIFVLHCLENLTTNEIAEKLQISQKTVQNQVGRATADFYDKVILSFIIFIALNGIIK